MHAKGWATGVIIVAVIACTDSSGPPPDATLVPTTNDGGLPAGTGRWFGRVVIDQDMKMLPGSGVQNLPGTTITKDHRERWRHTITIEEDGTRVTESQWILYDHQHTLTTSACFEQDATNVTDEHGEVKTTQAAKYFALQGDESGGYRAVELPATVMDATAVATSHNRVALWTCDGSTNQRSDNQAPALRTTALFFDRIAGSFGADKRAANGSAAYDLNGVATKVRWALKRDKEVVAKVGGPYRVERGKRITLDASQSRGDIDEYEWKVTPSDECANLHGLRAVLPKIGTEVKKTSKTFELTALCALDVALHVKGRAGEDDDEGTVTVAPREWDTKWVTPKVEAFPELDTNEAGTNRCAREGHVTPLSHYIHHDDNKTFRDSAYTLTKVEDAGGPFDGTFYVDTQTVSVERVEGFNPAYDPGGLVYDYNLEPAQNNGTIMALMPGQIRAHEAAHSALLKEWLDFVKGTSLDPARSIEHLAAASEEVIVDHADGLLREGDQSLCRSTRHPAVWEKLRASYDVEGQVFLPGGTPTSPPDKLYRFGKEALPCDDDFQ